MATEIQTAKLRALKSTVEILRDNLRSCSLCPRRCGVNRAKGKTGYCRAGLKSVVYSYAAHHGEEPPLSGTRGSGTIFFSHCNMKCAYCQNYRFSQLDSGREVSDDSLVKMMLELQIGGCHNINLVSPAHFLPQILTALEKAVAKGLDIPIVYNSSGYEDTGTLRLLNGIVDIYLPDMRYADNEMARRYSDAADYVTFNRSAVKEMRGQAGDLVLDKNGIAKKGLIIRLLVLPAGISGTKENLKFIRDNVSEKTYLSVMSQYYPAFKAHEHEELSRGLDREEYQNIVDEVAKLGLNNGWVQEFQPTPDPRFLGTNIKLKNTDL